MNFQGERILTLAEMCRKLETEEEKVLGVFMCTISFHPFPPFCCLHQILPFYSCSLDEEAQSEAASVLGQPPSEALAKVSQRHSQCLALSLPLSHFRLCKSTGHWRTSGSDTIRYAFDLPILHTHTHTHNIPLAASVHGSLVDDCTPHEIQLAKLVCVVGG